MTQQDRQPSEILSILRDILNLQRYYRSSEILSTLRDILNRLDPNDPDDPGEVPDQYMEDKE